MLLCLALGVAGAEARQAASTLRVVIIDSSDPSEPVAQGFGRAIRDALGRGPRPLEIYSEFLDTLRFAGESYEPEFVALLRRKYESRPPDLLVTVYPEALQFVERHRPELWSDTPTVFVGIPDDFPLWSAPTATVTGVRTHVDVSGTVALALSLRPGTRQVAVVSGVSAFDRLWRDRVSEALRPHLNRLEAKYLDGLAPADLASRLATLPTDAIVVFTTAFSTAVGPTTPIETAQVVARASQVPVFSLFEPTLGTGIVGGVMVSLAGEAARAGELALAIVGGTRPSELPITASLPSTVRVDWRAMQRFGLSERQLPAGAMVLFRPTSIWSEHRATIIAVLVVLGLQTALIATLLFERSQRRRAELRARQQAVELAHASRLATVGEITASIAHQINQPLAAILSNADAAEVLLETDRPPLDEVRQILADIRRDDERAHQVIQGIRALLGRREVQARPLHPNHAINRLMPVLQGEARRLNVALSADLGEGLPIVRGDTVHLQQVVLNLVMNALEAAAGRGERPRVGIRTGVTDTGDFEIAVSDSGPGIAPEQLPHLFDSFFTTKKNGMGLGLSIARSLVEMHGGRIWAENGNGGGATFRVVLPAGAPVLSGAEAAGASGAPETARLGLTQ